MRYFPSSLSQIYNPHANMAESKIEKDLLLSLLMFLSRPKRHLRVGQRILSCVPSFSLPAAVTTTINAPELPLLPSSNVCTSLFRPKKIDNTNSAQPAKKSRTQTSRSNLRVKGKGNLMMRSTLLAFVFVMFLTGMTPTPPLLLHREAHKP